MRGRNLSSNRAAVAGIRTGDAKASGARINVCIKAEAVDVSRTARLDKDCLPDAAGGRVPTPLFAHRLLVIVHRVLDAQDQPPVTRSIRRFLQGVGQVEFKGRITAL